MVDENVSCTSAVVKLVELAGEDGHSVFILHTYYTHLVCQGVEEISLKIRIRPPAPWVTVSEAARLHLDDVDGISVDVARAKVSRACDNGKIRHSGKNRERRIDPESLDAWRLRERERNLRREAE